MLVAMGMGERCSWKGKLARSAGMFTGDVMTCVCYVTIIMIVCGACMEPTCSREKVVIY